MSAYWIGNVKVTNEEAKKIYPDGWETIKPYLRKVPDPVK